MSGTDRLRPLEPHPGVEPVGPFGMRVAAGDLLFVEGQVAYDEQGRFVGEGDPAAQTRQALANVEKVLAAAGAGWGDVAKLNTYVVDNAAWPEVRAARLAVLGAHRPASTLVTVAALAEPRILVEIEAVAAV